MASTSPADLILFNGRIRTLDARLPLVESLACSRGVIVAAGTDEEVAAAAGRGIQRLNLEGRMVIPGLTDAHIHLAQYALRLDQLDCGAPSLEECLDRVRRRAAVAPEGEWVLGHGWNQNDCGHFGACTDLDRAAPGHPVYLTAKSLHAAWVNSSAMSLADVGMATPDPPGGKIQREPSGRPTGILFESAMDLVARTLPAPSVERVTQALEAAQPALWRVGLTGVHDFDGGTCRHGLEALRERGHLGIRVVKHLHERDIDEALDLGLPTDTGDAWIRHGNLKLFADGALGPRTAAMLDPYLDQADNAGMLLLSQDELTAVGERAVQAGLALAIHAIGDRANREALDALSRLRRFESEHGLPRLRHRIEHAQLVHCDDLSRFHSLGVVASMQPAHATSDMHMADIAWGQRVQTAYAWQSLLRSNAILAFGSDAPVEDPNPFRGLHAAVTRCRPDGSPSPEGWVPSERLNLQQALYAYTGGPALAAGLEATHGRLAPGCWADAVVLERDLFDCPPDELADLRVLGALVAGVWRFRTF